MAKQIVANQIQGDISLPITQFGGQKDDLDPKLIPPQNFQKIVNWNFPDDGGGALDKIYVPAQVFSLTGTPSAGKPIDGIKEYDNHYYLISHRYLYVYDKAWLPFNYFQDGAGGLVNYVFLGTTDGAKASMIIYNQCLFMFTGVDYPRVFDHRLIGGAGTGGGYHDDGSLVAGMGAPINIVNRELGAGAVLPGTYYYAMTFITSGGEEITGTQSVNVVLQTVATSFNVYLYIPIGYYGTLQRNIYRTKAGGSTFYLLTTIADNTTTSYTDTTSDSSLSATVRPAINNECPRTYFATSANSQLYGTKDGTHPTQVYATDVNNLVWDSANYIGISDHANDNTNIEGIGSDFSNVFVGTAKNIYLLQPSTANISATSVSPLRSYVGIKSGYTVKNLPAFADFQGGLIFVSSLNDVRIINGLDAIPVVSTVGNIRTQNFGQDMKGTFNQVLSNPTNMDAEVFGYLYHLLVDGIKYVFDIRNQQWTTHNIKTASYSSAPLTLAQVNTTASGNPIWALLNGQADGTIQQEYSSIQYKSQNVPAYAVSGYISATRNYKQITKIVFWCKAYQSTGGTATIQIILDDNTNAPINTTLTVPNAPFDSRYFDWKYFQTTPAMDFVVVNINVPFRWFQYSVNCTSGNISLQSIEFIGEQLMGKESMKTIADIMWETMQSHLKNIVEKICNVYESDSKYHVKKFYENNELMGFCVYYDEDGVRFFSEGHYIGKNKFVALKMWNFVRKGAKIIRSVVQKTNTLMINIAIKLKFKIIKEDEINLFFEKAVNTNE